MDQLRLSTDCAHQNVENRLRLFLGGSIHQFVFNQPTLCCRRIGADQKDLLYRSCRCELAFKARTGWILNLKAAGRFAFTNLDPSRNNSRDVGTSLDDRIENPIQAPYSPMLAL